MPSTLHESLCELLASEPTILGVVAPQLATLGLAGEATITRASSSFADLRPASLCADALLQIDGAPCGSVDVVLEIQLSCDPDKPRAWLSYAALNCRRTGRPTEVVVLTTQDAVAEWARGGVSWCPRYRFVPLVVGPRDLRCPPELERIASTPQIAVLLAICQPNNLDLAPALAVASHAIAELPESDRALYSNLLSQRVSDELKRLAEDLMNKPIADNWKRHVPAWYPELRDQLLSEGREEGREEGRHALLALAADALTREQLDRAHAIASLAELQSYIRGCMRNPG